MSRVIGGNLETYIQTHKLGRVPHQHVRMITGMVLRWIRESSQTTTTDISRFIRPRTIMFGSMWDATTIRVNMSAELDPVIEAAYICPDARMGKPYTVHSACVWALGALMYHMLTGELPVYTVSDREISSWIKYPQVVWADPQRPLLIVLVQEMLCVCNERPDLVYVARLINDYM